MDDSVDSRKLEYQSSDPDLPGPFAVGRYAAKVREWMRERPQVLLEGEVVDFKVRRGAVYFELRDGDGAVPVALWRDVFERLDLPEGEIRDGARVVIAGGPDYYPGSQVASPAWSFRATHVRLAGEGDLLARLARLRRELDAAGLFEPQKQLRLPRLPKRIGLVTAEGSAAKADVLAGLARRGWGGELVFCDVAVQNRRAAPEVGRALQELVAVGGVEVILVCRGGGSPVDLLGAFCDEVLCRTVALLPIPVISAIGHETDNCLLDDVAAVSCSTPTHAPERLVAYELAGERVRLAATRRLDRARGSRGGEVAEPHPGPSRQQRRPSGARAPRPASPITPRDPRSVDARPCRSGAAAAQLRSSCNPQARGRRDRRGSSQGELSDRARRVRRASGRAIEERQRAIEELARTVNAHDPQRVLERGFARIEADGGRTVSDARAAREAGTIRVRFARDDVEADVRDERGERDPT